MRLLLCLLMGFSFVAQAESFSTDKTYLKLVGNFETEAECEAYKKKTGAWFNCYQTIKFKTDGTALVILTDIMNIATYSIDQNQITVRPKSAGDMPPLMAFEVLSEDQIQRKSDGSLWNLLQ